jgi:NADPH:quinone reductase-like Zn-dependent oxidoreductase
MRAMVLTGHGDVDQLSLRHDYPEPTPGTNEVLVRTHAAAVNNTDINTRVGWYSGGGWTGSFTFPRIQGIDGCGTIEAVGDGVDPARVGERVLIEPCWRSPGQPFHTARFVGSEVDGTFAEYIAVPARHAHRVVSSLSSVELATFPCSYSTAENMLRRLQVGQGDRVLVTGASGGVGSAAVQLAAARGCAVVGVCADSKAELVRAAGAEHTVARDAVGGAGMFDAVVDVVGGAQWPMLLGALRPGGKLACSGAIDGANVDLDLRTLYLHDLQLVGCTVLDPETFPALVEHIERRALRPLVAATYPLSELVAAQQHFLRKDFVGKIAISI